MLYRSATQLRLSIFLLVAMSMLSSVVFGQQNLTFINSQEKDFLQLKFDTNFSYKQNDAIKATRTVIDEAAKICKLNHIQFEILHFKNLKGQDYPVLVILPALESSQNKEALRVYNTMNKMKLVFSPYDLGNSIDAYYDPDQGYIGVSYKFLTQISDSDNTYKHELYHVETLLNLNKASAWAGLIEAKKRTFVSTKNDFGYHNFLSIDELLTTAFSLKLSGDRIYQLKKALSIKDFNESRGYADEELREIYHLAQSGYYLALQLADVITRALSVDPSSIDLRYENYKIGEENVTYPETLFYLDAYERKHTVGFGTSYVPVQKGTQFKLLWVDPNISPNHESLKRRLIELKGKAEISVAHFKNVKDSIFVLIDYPQIEKTNIEKLFHLSQIPFSLLL